MVWRQRTEILEDEQSTDMQLIEHRQDLFVSFAPVMGDEDRSLGRAPFAVDIVQAPDGWGAGISDRQSVEAKDAERPRDLRAAR